MRALLELRACYLGPTFALTNIHKLQFLMELALKVTSTNRHKAATAVLCKVVAK